MKTKEASTLEIVSITKDKLDRAVQKRRGSIYLQPQCHPKSVCKALCEDGTLRTTCWECGRYMFDLLLNEDDDFQIAPCDHHPEHYAAVTLAYDGKLLIVRCGVKGCRHLLHKLKVREA